MPPWRRGRRGGGLRWCRGIATARRSRAPRLTASDQSTQSDARNWNPIQRAHLEPEEDLDEKEGNSDRGQLEREANCATQVSVIVPVCAIATHSKRLTEEVPQDKVRRSAKYRIRYLAYE